MFRKYEDFIGDLVIALLASPPIYCLIISFRFVYFVTFMGE